jgi:small subunit ribosomal protein S16
MVKIRLQRLGRKKRPFYRIVVVDIRTKRAGATLAQLGFYNPLSRELRLDKAEATEWVKKGAQMTTSTERLYKMAPESGELIVLEKVRQEKLSKKAVERQKAEVDAKAKAEAEAKAQAEEAKTAAEAAPAEEEAVPAEAAVEETPAAEEPAAE